MAALIPAAGSSLAPGYGHGTDQENPEYEVEATRRCARSGRTRPLPSQHWSAPTVQIEPIDHLVLTVRNVVATCAFYEQVLGPYVVTFGEERTALAFGEQKLDLHDGDHEFDPKATHPTPGAIDLCLFTRMGPVIPARAHRCARRSTRWRPGPIVGGSLGIIDRPDWLYFGFRPASITSRSACGRTAEKSVKRMLMSCSKKSPVTHWPDRSTRR